MKKFKQGYPCTIITGYKNVTTEEVKDLWDKGVDLDDWDYIIVLPPETLKESSIINFYTKEKETMFEQKIDRLDRLLTGSCADTWYKVEFRGELRALGVAYHA